MVGSFTVFNICMDCMNFTPLAEKQHILNSPTDDLEMASDEGLHGGACQHSIRGSCGHMTHIGSHFTNHNQSIQHQQN